MDNDIYENLKLDRQLCFLLYASSKGMVQAYKPFLGKLGITYPQYLVMLVLWEEDNIPLKQLGSRLFLDSGTLTPMLKRLASQGFLIKERSVDDEREIRIRLTEQGQKLKDAAKDIPVNMSCELELTEDYIEQLKELLKAFVSKTCGSP
ncbi:MarR family winged helix-turn-helix transcriptional regulator [Pseudobacteriovorax antillogorgiicola]|uniref:Transcriptional regulator, MarR family n=1 Tax=Pseudobacteriovorax antillogorgiicola TaxID=1513793 RepID=A0A1Y6CEL2_9BACT|nr:MarR family transcriptional regulator [Pseudobacteriovorax antillogorgiicola]TCS47599.1 MarR family transcriptional regulator [Pseudobacteriovorax antillogorgiicola]SMF60150.1 transcriptional regulator, MarR family [Pseudobacteriovorax antillogorgiicola]